jgi:hypothetical protein
VQINKRAGVVDRGVSEGCYRLSAWQGKAWRSRTKDIDSTNMTAGGITGAAAAAPTTATSRSYMKCTRDVERDHSAASHVHVASMEPANPCSAWRLPSAG